VFDYLDPLKFLNDIFEWRKRFAPDFSYSAWSEEAGFRSRTYVRLMLLGKRQITDGSIHLLTKALKLRGSEADYFASLVRFSQAKSLDERESHLKVLRAILKSSRSSRVVHEKYQFLSSYLVPRVQVMLMLPDFTATVANLASHLKVHEGKVSEILETLASLRLAEPKTQPDGNVVWSAKLESLEVEDRSANAAIQSFHSRSLDEAKEALSLPVETRNFQAIALALTDEQYKELSAELVAFLDGALQRHKPVAGKTKKVYQLNANLIPVTPSLRSPVSTDESAPEVTHEDDQIFEGDPK
jgi:uncharacterized protein (TIGR02147 family)